MKRLGIYKKSNDVAKNLLHDNVYIVYCIRESEEDAFYDVTTNASSCCVSFVVMFSLPVIWLWWIVPLIARWTETHSSSCLSTGHIQAFFIDSFRYVLQTDRFMLEK